MIPSSLSVVDVNNDYTKRAYIRVIMLNTIGYLFHPGLNLESVVYIGGDYIKSKPKTTNANIC